MYVECINTNGMHLMYSYIHAWALASCRSNVWISFSILAKALA